MLGRYNDVLRALAAEENTLLIDLARQLPKDSRYFYDTLHFTNEGAKRLGIASIEHCVRTWRKKFPIAPCSPVPVSPHSGAKSLLAANRRSDPARQRILLHLL